MKRISGTILGGLGVVEVGLIFGRDHIRLILEGVKTQTRRRHGRPLKAGRIYDVKRDWYHSTGHKILITDVYRQRLRDITPEEDNKEGNYTVDEFIEEWKDINGSWEPDEVVWVYEFKCAWLG
jgi:hypothetical protein